MKVTIFKTIFVLLFLVVFAWSCKKDPADCFRSTGPQKTETRSLEPFSNLVIHNNLNVELCYDSINPHLTISAGENLLSGITSRIENNTLVLGNSHICNWVRSFEKPITIKLFYQRLDSIEFRSAGLLSCADTLKADSIYVSVKEGGGTIKLILNTQKSFINHEYGTADVHLYGRSEVNYIYQANYGPVIADSLYAKFNFLENFGTNLCKVYAEIQLGVTISGPGNVYYRGNPAISLVKTGSGNLIRIED
jgi:hypothetical protein